MLNSKSYNLCINRISDAMGRYDSLVLKSIINCLVILRNQMVQTAITWENNENSGAWGSEGRIHFYRRSIPRLGTLKFTAGNGSIIYRVNYNPFVENLSKYHGFVQGKYQNISRIRATIPPAYLKDFDMGLKL